MNEHSNTRVIVVVIAISALLQIALAPNVAIRGAIPNFLLVAVVCVAMLTDSRTGCLVGFFCGLLFDLVGIGPLGVMTATLTLVGYLTGYFAKNLITESLTATMIFLVVCALISELIYCIFLAITGEVASFGQSLYMRVLPSAVYDTIFAAICFPLVRRYLKTPTDRMRKKNQLM